MADFVAVLKKTLDGLGETTPHTRARVYDKARSTIEAKLAAINPPPPAAAADRQRRALEDAIATVEKGYGRPAPAVSDPLAELESIFSSIDRNRTQASHARPAAKVEPAAPRPETGRQTEATTRKPEPSVEAMPAWETTTAHGAARPASGAQPSLAGAGEGRSAAAAPDDFFSDDDAQTPGGGRSVEDDRPQRRYGGLVAAALALLVIAGGAYGVWSNKDAFKDVLGLNDEAPVTVTPVKEASQEKPAEETAAATPPASETTPPVAAESGEAQKFTQRLLADGSETDPGPAAGQPGIGEGSSVVALTTPPPLTPLPGSSEPGEAATAPADAATAAPTQDTPAQPAVAVGQKAIYYEERTSAAEGSAEPGSIVWSLVQESPGGDAPPEPAIRAEATIPGKDVQLRMTIRRNTDQTLPASHIIEMIFLTPDNFEGGGIDNVLRIAMKRAEQDAGNPLIGIPAKIADGYFLVALNDTKADEAANLALLRNQQWIDIPVVYKSGRRALLTMEKGIPGDKVFDEALKAWQEKAAG